MAGDLIRIRTVREPGAPTSPRAGLVVLVSLVASALMLVPTGWVTFWVLGQDADLSTRQVWGLLLLSATLAGLINLWLARRIDPGWQAVDHVLTAVVCALFGTALGVFALFMLFLALLPGEG